MLGARRISQELRPWSLAGAGLPRKVSRDMESLDEAWKQIAFAQKVLCLDLVVVTPHRCVHEYNPLSCT